MENVRGMLWGCAASMKQTKTKNKVKTRRKSMKPEKIEINGVLIKKRDHPALLPAENLPVSAETSHAKLLSFAC